MFSRNTRGECTKCTEIRICSPSHDVIREHGPGAGSLCRNRRTARRRTGTDARTRARQSSLLITCLSHRPRIIYSHFRAAKARTRECTPAVAKLRQAASTRTDWVAGSAQSHACRHSIRPPTAQQLGPTSELAMIQGPGASEQRQ